MIRCKCGKFTNYGITCSNCRSSYFQKKYEEPEEDFEEAVKSDIPYDELEDFLNREEDDD